MTDYLDVTGHLPDDRPAGRRPAPPAAAGATMPPVSPADFINKHFNARPFPAIFYAGCGDERADLYPLPTE